MSNRLRLRGCKLEQRNNTFVPFPHRRAGSSAPHVFDDVSRRTNALFAKRQPDFERHIAQDRISALKSRLVEKKPLALPSTRPFAERHPVTVVDLGEPEPGIRPSVNTSSHSRFRRSPS